VSPGGLPRNYGLGLFYQLEVRDPGGRVVKRTRWRRSHSYVIAFLKFIRVAFENIGLSITDTGGVSRIVDRPTAAGFYFMFVFAGDDVSSHGIVVGTGTTAPTNTDYKLEAQIPHGTATGQLDHDAHDVIQGPTEVAGNVDYIFRRNFYNGSGASITVNEVGIYCLSRDTDGVYRYFCLVRDVLPTSVTVGAGYTLTVKYTLRTTV